MKALQFFIVFSCIAIANAWTAKASTSLTGEECKAKGGHVVSARHPGCDSQELKIGNVTGYKCACICCASDRPQRLIFSGIPEATKSSVPDIRDAHDWKNPYVVVKADGIQIVGGDRVSIGDLEAALAAIPLTGWPYGRVIAVQESGLVSKFEENRRETLKQVLDLLKKLKIKAKCWPSA